MSKHTRGPWVVRGGAYSTHNADVRFWETGVLSDIGWVAQSNGASIEEADANARLIAAAPELLEACKRACYDHENTGKHCGLSPSTYQELLDTIAKAEGQ